MAKVEVMREDRLNKRISHMPGVKLRVRAQGEVIYAQASAKLAVHRQEYQARLTISTGQTDTVITLIDPAALSIEFGHFAGPRGQAGRTWVPGLNLFEGYRYKDGVI